MTEDSFEALLAAFESCVVAQTALDVGGTAGKDTLAMMRELTDAKKAELVERFNRVHGPDWEHVTLEGPEC